MIPAPAPKRNRPPPAPPAPMAPSEDRPLRRPPVVALRADIFTSCAKPGPTEKSPVKCPAKCIACVQPLQEDDTTNEMVCTPYADRVYVYGAHRKCWDSISESERRCFNRVLLDVLMKGDK